MTVTAFAPRFPLVIERRKALDRRGAAAVLREDLANGPQTGEFWHPFAQAAAQLGEHAMSIEAARRYCATRPNDLDHVMFYAMILSRNNRQEDADQQFNALSARDRAHPAVLHFRGMDATHRGDFDLAEKYLRQALAISPAPVQWLALSVAKKFTPDDPDIAAMESIIPRVGRAPSDVRAHLFYALGKAYDDIKEIDKAAAAYAAGATLMNNAMAVPDGKEWTDFVNYLLSGYTAENMAQLKPSGAGGERMLFVTGFPRSGTTLVEQILTSHSQVGDGSELNLVPVALMPAGNLDYGNEVSEPLREQSKRYLVAGDYTFDDALAYQNRSNSSDPWGDIGRDYLQMAEERFGPDKLAVDKTLNLGSFMGLLVHALPKAKIFWLRRRPEDCALSNYRLCSTLGTLPWTYSATSIADFFKAEDQLYAHWTKMFPDRIMTVPYEELVSDPQTWIRRILDHAGLSEEPQVFEPHKSKRTVTTASVAQVRAPISTSRIGAADAYSAFTEEFRKAYYGS